MFLKLGITLACLLSMSFSWECGGPRDDIRAGPSNRRSLLTRSSDQAPIRITPVYLDFQLSNAQNTEFFKKTLFPVVENYLKTRLKVNNVQQNIVAQYPSCIDFNIPLDHQTIGVPDTDLIIYIKAEDDPSQNYAAYAGSCEYDSNYKYNPIIGLMMINDYYFKDYDFPTMYSLVLHEIHHILGFSRNLYKFWKDSNGELYSDPVVEKTMRGYSKMVLQTPNIVAKAREAFGCSTLTGVELENYGSSGTAGSHWEKRIMYNDFMIGHVTQDPIFTTITLALLKDTGWYDVDYSKADVPIFGRGLGCSFFDEECSSFYTSPKLFCSEEDEPLCDVLSLRKSTCFDDGFSDDCYIMFPYSDGDCRSTNASKTYTSDGGLEVVGPNSHCFEASVSTSKYLDLNIRCYEVTQCSSLGATVKIGTYELLCPFTGGTFVVPGLYGTITCPSSKILCEDFPCIESCRGRGTCVNGICVCDQGYSGYSCQYLCDSSCKVCNETVCFTCHDANAVINGKVCECKEGYEKNADGLCISKCGVLCVSCLDQVCLKCAQNSGFLNSVCTCKFNYVLSGSSCICPPGSFDSGSGCSLCSEDCLTCLNTTYCSSCNTGLVLRNGLCKNECPSFCSLCSSPLICSECDEGYSLTDGICKALCSENCKTCLIPSVCLKCESGYALNYDRTCQEKCSENCDICSSPSLCVKCNDGYMILDDYCIKKCHEYCKTCQSVTWCGVCESGYRVNSLGYCIPECSYDCRVCDDKGDCLVCEDGYYVNSGRCYDCPSGCRKCSHNECLDCYQSRYLKNSECYYCLDDNCKRCNEFKCYACYYGYYLKDGKCVN